MIINKVRSLLRRILGIPPVYTGPHIGERDITELKLLIARLHIKDMNQHGIYHDIHDSEFQVFSQFGDDGIIQYLIHYSGITGKLETFIEFGVQNYRESNTRFLLLNNNWKGLILDASEAYMNQVKQEELYWRHDLTAVAKFITIENVNELFRSNGFYGDIGLLSIDIDGNDYWVWQHIEAVNPVIVIVEYNSLFGCERAVTVPYDQEFDRTKAHYSYLYWGCSLKSLALLGKKKGYALVGSNSAGNNAYFVREDKLGSIRPLSVTDAYVKAKFREARDEHGNLSFLPREQGLELIGDMPLVDVEQNTTITARNLI